MINLRDYSCIVDNLIGNIFQLLVQLIHTHNAQIIVNADVYLTTISIGKAGYPFQVFVLPNALMLYVLILLIHIANILHTADIHNSTFLNRQG